MMVGMKHVGSITCLCFIAACLNAPQKTFEGTFKTSCLEHATISLVSAEALQVIQDRK